MRYCDVLTPVDLSKRFIFWLVNISQSSRPTNILLRGMSCCCCPETDAARTPLLSPDKGQPVTRQPKSARHNKPASCDAGESPLIVPIDCKPVRVANVDKRLKDHAELYNEHLIRNQNRKDAIERLKEIPDSSDKSLYGVFTELAQHCDNTDSFNLKRKTQYNIQIEYEERKVDRRIASAFKAFNEANKYTKEIMDKGPPLVNSIELVLNNERELRRDVLVASLGAEGPDCMKNCMDNISQLKKVPAVVEVIKKETIRDFEELKNAVQIILLACTNTPKAPANEVTKPEEPLIDLHDGGTCGGGEDQTVEPDRHRSQENIAEDREDKDPNQHHDGDENAGHQSDTDTSSRLTEENRQ